MEQGELIERLLHFGLTRQEALIYVTLTVHGELTGYETAKLIGVSRSNAYNALAGLTEKGASYCIEGASKKYISVPLAEFCENKIRSLKEDKEYLIEYMPGEKANEDGYITIEGRKHIVDKLKNMLEQAKLRVYIAMDYVHLEPILTELFKLADLGIKVVLLTDQPIEMDGIQYYLNKSRNKQIHVITDSRYVLTGEINDTCLYSGQKNFVSVFKESLRNEIKLLELTGGKK